MSQPFESSSTPPAPAAPAPGTPGTPEATDHGREAPRQECLHLAKLHGDDRGYQVAVVDISRTGVLLTIVDRDWELSEEQHESGMAGLMVASRFSRDMRLEFAEYGIEIELEPVRIATQNHDGRISTSLGCCFGRELDDEEAHALGAETGTGATNAAGAAPGAASPERGDDANDAGGVAVVGEGAVQIPGGGTVVIQAPGEGKKRYERKPARIRVYPGGDPLSFADLLAMTLERRATDLHVKGGSPLRLRQDGTLVPIGEHVLTSADADALLHELLSAEQYERFEEDGDLDMAHTLPGVGRFRINVFRAQGEIGLAIRRIPEQVPSIDDLGLSPVCKTMSDKPRGLVLVTGPTGSGKSTTLAAMIDHINRTRPCHIVTMEDPIEYRHTEVRAQITQREIGEDTSSFTAALRRALRQDPDVILVGEMRDLETIALAVTAAETGHLVFGTLHTTSAGLTVDRVIDVFPPAQQRQIRMQLADALQAILSQTMLPRRGGGLVVAQEILVATKGVRALIREGKAHQIGNMMQTGGAEGMITLEDALNRLVAEGRITYETAVSKANHPDAIRES